MLVAVKISRPSRESGDALPFAALSEGVPVHFSEGRFAPAGRQLAPACRAAQFEGRCGPALVAAIGMLAALRLWFMAVLPLTDTTEARYAEIVRIGLLHGFWLMPHADATTPFFAKPPLSTWLSMLATRGLGWSEFAVRLPQLLA